MIVRECVFAMMCLCVFVAVLEQGYYIVLLKCTGGHLWSPSRDMSKVDIIQAGGVVCELADAVMLAPQGKTVAIAVSSAVQHTEYDLARSHGLPVVSWVRY